MPDDKKPMDDWFVGGEEVKKPEPKPAPPPKPPAPPPPPEPAAKPPVARRLLAALVLLALLGYGGFYIYRLRFRPAKVQEVLTTPVIPQPGEEAPPPIVQPAPEQKKTVVRPPKPPAKLPAPKEEEPVQPPVPQVEPPPKPKPEQPPVQSSGIMLWSGKVEKNGTIVIDEGKSATGTVNGTALPGFPVTVRVEPKGFTVAEPPSAANSWKRIAIHSQKKAHIVVTVFWNVKQ